METVLIQVCVSRTSAALCCFNESLNGSEINFSVHVDVVIKYIGYKYCDLVTHYFIFVFLHCIVKDETNKILFLFIGF